MRCDFADDVSAIRMRRPTASFVFGRAGDCRGHRVHIPTLNVHDVVRRVRYVVEVDFAVGAEGDSDGVGANIVCLEVDRGGVGFGCAVSPNGGTAVAAAVRDDEGQHYGGDPRTHHGNTSLAGNLDGTGFVLR
ncbi:hypothetical protein BACI71_260001 [Bacillus mycoides]|uniref:Uncharacterized protein n=1 Tax=Bacillus mycoides TaxID=1405 RepID=A0A653VYZ1_BACMY|nr:hypothetical protein BACI71_260001 [Bacillus mycoides]